MKVAKLLSWNVYDHMLHKLFAHKCYITKISMSTVHFLVKNVHFKRDINFKIFCREKERIPSILIDILRI